MNPTEPCRRSRSIRVSEAADATRPLRDSSKVVLTTLPLLLGGLLFHLLGRIEEQDGGLGIIFCMALGLVALIGCTILLALVISWID